MKIFHYLLMASTSLYTHSAVSTAKSGLPHDLTPAVKKRLSMCHRLTGDETCFNRLLKNMPNGYAKVSYDGPSSPKKSG